LDATELIMLGHDRGLFAVHVTDEDVGVYKVSEAGWYAADDGETVVLGPFESLAECEQAIRDEKRPPRSSLH
jgi:hypothetical protein